jgi:hypothetical protein
MLLTAKTDNDSFDTTVTLLAPPALKLNKLQQQHFGSWVALLHLEEGVEA